MRAERHRRAGCRTQPGTVTMNMTTLFSQMFVLAILMGIGFLARRVQVMDAGFSRQLSDLLLHIAIPAMIIASVGKGDPFADISDMLYVLGICTLVNALMVPLAAAAGINVLAVSIPMGLAGNLLRAVSPVSAVVMIVAGSIKKSPIDIVRRTSVPMIAGVIVMFILSMAIFLPMGA